MQEAQVTCHGPHAYWKRSEAKILPWLGSNRFKAGWKQAYIARRKQILACLISLCNWRTLSLFEFINQVAPLHCWCGTTSKPCFCIYCVWQILHDPALATLLKQASVEILAVILSTLPLYQQCRLFYSHWDQLVYIWHRKTLQSFWWWYLHQETVMHCFHVRCTYLWKYWSIFLLGCSRDKVALMFKTQLKDFFISVWQKRFRYRFQSSSLLPAGWLSHDLPFIPSFL